MKGKCVHKLKKITLANQKQHCNGRWTRHQKLAPSFVLTGNCFATEKNKQRTVNGKYLCQLLLKYKQGWKVQVLCNYSNPEEVLSYVNSDQMEKEHISGKYVFGNRIPYINPSISANGVPKEIFFFLQVSLYAQSVKPPAVTKTALFNTPRWKQVD